MRQPTIGLEIHLQLLTETKMFCRCKASFGDLPNTNVCPVCMGYPGALPVPNKKAVEMGILLGKTLNGTVNLISDFSRKNYFYPDMPKGYQITQDTIPLISNGYLVVGESSVQIERVHVEEDSAKMIHENESKKTLINYNRCGVPLLEVVTAPCIKKPEDAGLFLEKLQQLVMYLGISTGKMEEGALRCDVNVSLDNPDGSLGQKVEVKNLNSFRAVVRAIKYEIERQDDCLNKHENIFSETRTWDESKGETVTMRIKDSKSDYRYFPEPDLHSLFVTEEMITNTVSQMPELPHQACKRLKDNYNLSEYDISLMTENPETLQYFDECLSHFEDAKLIANWISSEIMKCMNKKNCSINEVGIQPSQLTDLLSLIKKGTISGTIAKTVFEEVIETKKNPSVIVQEKGLLQVTDENALKETVIEVLRENEKEVERYKAGNKKLFGLFMGQCMKKTKGKGNPKILNKILMEVLSE